MMSLDKAKLVKISHTAKELFLSSPRAYYLKYLLRLREATLGSPLFFGTNVEIGVNVLLKGGNLEDAYKSFEKSMNLKYEFNGEKLNLATSNKVRYSKSDFQEHLFDEKELKDLESKDYNFKAHQSLIRSGKLMIKEFHDNILPKIKRVIDMQKYICIENPTGDKIFGYADLICEWEDGRLLVPDIKTSSSKYPDDSLENEEKGTQTAVYYSALKDEYKLDGTGFFVLEKKIRKKKDNPTRSQTIIGTPSEDIIQKTFDQYDTVAYNIKMGNFPCASPKCDKPWGECTYKKFCQSNGCDTTGLVKVGKEKK